MASTISDNKDVKIENTSEDKSKLLVAEKKKPSRKSKPRVSTDPQREIRYEPNYLSNFIENKGEEDIYFKWNGRSIFSFYTLVYGKYYTFAKLDNLTKAKVLNLFGTKRNVVSGEYKGRAGVLTKNNYPILEGMTARQMADVPMVNLSDDKTVAEVESWNTGSKEVIKIARYGLPYVTVDTVELVTKAEYEIANKEQSLMKAKTTSSLYDDEIRVE